MSSRALLRRLRKLEKVFAADEPEDDCLDVLLWGGDGGGVFGHVHCRFSKGGGRSEWAACSDEEEVAIMRRHYERDGRRLYGRGSIVSFAEYLEHFSYLGAEESAAKRKLIIEELKREDEDSGC